MGDRACIAIIENQHILMVRQTYRDKTFWTFPGGAIQEGEDPQTAAIREAKEEVNVSVEVLRILYQGPRTNANGMYYCFEGHIIKGEVKLGYDPELAEDAQELHDVRWFPIKQVETHPEVSRILEPIRDHLSSPK